jgi:predicted MFS family arabinose efflux permease
VVVDRRPRREVLLFSTAGRSLVLAAIAAAVAAEGPLAVVLTLSALFTAFATAHKPAQAALLPALAETPRQIAASNAILTAIDNVGFLAGALLGGVLVAAASFETAFLVMAGVFAAAAWPLARIPRDPVPGYREHEDDGEQAFAELASGFRTTG